jgi:hypothetical protein
VFPVSLSPDLAVEQMLLIIFKFCVGEWDISAKSGEYEGVNLVKKNFASSRIGQQ